jgi:hypothetical protein
MSFKISGFRSRAVKRRQLSRNQVAAKERIRLQRLAEADANMEREIAEAQEWAMRNPALKLPPGAKIRIEIPGLPTKTVTVRRWTDGKILAGNRETTAKQLGRKIGMLLDQFLPEP